MTGPGADSRELRLAEIMEGLMRRIEAGEPVDRERCREEHPELTAELDELLPALEAMERLGAAASDPEAVETHEPFVGDEDPEGSNRTLGDYRLLAELGRGGMGVVYEAEQLSLGRRVALKVLPFAAVLDDRQIRRFRNEAYAAAQLQHEHIVPVYAVGCERGVHFYAMRLIEGNALDSVIAELRRLGLGRRSAPDATAIAASHLHGGDAPWAEAAGPAAKDPASSAGDPIPVTPRRPMPPSGRDDGNPVKGLGNLFPCAERTRGATFFRNVAQVGAQAADALDHAHAAGIIHRDVKPANLILDEQGRVWVTDFGLARCRGTDGVTLTGDLVGTLRYMSPEQAAAKVAEVDERTDIYSLGATLYELLTGEPACDGRDRREILQRIALEDPPAPRRLNRAIPRDLETIVLKALEKEPAARYASAGAMRDDLRAFLVDRPIRARRPGPVGVARKWIRRNRALSAGATAALLLAFCAWGVVSSILSNIASREFDVILREATLSIQPRPIDQILSDLERARAIRPEAPEVPFARALALRAAGHGDEALRELSRVTNLDPAFSSARTLETLLLFEGADPEWSARPGALYLVDDFADGGDYGWARGTGDTFADFAPMIHDASNGSYRFASTGEVPPGRSGAMWSTWNGTIRDGYLRITVRVDSEDTGAGVVLRFRPGLRGYDFFVNTGCRCIGVERCGGGGGDGPCPDVWFIPGLEVRVGETWHLEAGAVGDRLSLKAWRPGETEPAEPQLVVHDGHHSEGTIHLIVLARFHRAPVRVDATFDDLIFSPAIAAETEPRASGVTCGLTPESTE